jgi:hypothetical protein
MPFFNPLAMKQGLTALLLLIFCRIAAAQDSIPVTFHQESDTLVKQRFIDRYENVFMTKVPTRQMFKVAAVASEIQGAGINFGYEYKVIPALSVEASIYSQLSEFNMGLANELAHFSWKGMNLWANVKGRWYYNMNKRIERGLNANNFSGAYVGFSFEQTLLLSDSYMHANTSRLGLLYGFQSRFLNNGYIDFAAGLFQKKIGPYNILENPTRFNPKNFVLGTQANIGLAFGDWKKNAARPLCDVLRCDESINGQLKIAMPDIAIGLKNQLVRANVAYEQRIGRSPLSVQLSPAVSLDKVSVTNFLNATYFQAGASLEVRYYFLQKYLMRRGKAGENFSGPYAGLSAGYYFASNKVSFKYQPEHNEHVKYRILSTNLQLGYQQRLFKRLYIDGSIFYGKQRLSGFELTGGSPPFLSSKMSIGWTF